ncbi:MAG: site-specific DNA-methyltransferase, partial [Alphaproteobacteria bacterium]|nr:site-specific DNA-methyltransferase [Alphaproteobacteria bacterium]
MMLIHGDCLTELRKLKKNSIDLIYLDPPFFTQSMPTLRNRDCSTEYSFNDKWINIEAYIQYIKERLKLCKDVLKDTGSIFLHCDRSASHYLRGALDEIFGYNNFQSEIIWFYKRWSNSKKGLLNSHQIIFFYSKTNNFKFNMIYTNYSPTTNIDQIFQKRARDKNGKTIYKQNNNNIELLGEKKGVPLSDVWEIPYLNPKAKERVGYPTQKPILLLERIIEIVTDKGDLVLDPFCGSGTTLVASQLMGRKFIGID